QNGKFNPRDIFGSRTDTDHIYNTPRAWHMGRYLTSRSLRWDGTDPRLTPESDDLPWSLVPDRKVTVEDMIYLLSAHFQGTDFDPYIHRDTGKRGIYRSIGINRTGVTSICQIRPEGLTGIEWIAFGSTTFSAFYPVYPNVPKLPEYLSKVAMDVSTHNLYWSSRLLDALADMAYADTIREVERYHAASLIDGRKLLLEYDAKMAEICPDPANAPADVSAKIEKLALEANAKICKMAEQETQKALTTILQKASEKMRNGFKLSDN
ncbi:MAG: C69 family dipeptidase, partial [bacterium]